MDKLRCIRYVTLSYYGLDYGDNFSPVAKMAFVHLFLAMAAIRMHSCRVSWWRIISYGATTWVCCPGGVRPGLQVKKIFAWFAKVTLSLV